MIDYVARFFLLKDTSGNKSWSLSIAVYGFLVTVLCIFAMVFEGTTISLSENIKVVISSPDISFLIFFLPTCFGLYGWRRQEQASTEVKRQEIILKNDKSQN